MLVTTFLSCKHRLGPPLPVEGSDILDSRPRYQYLQEILPQAKLLQIVELFDDGFVASDTGLYRLDLTENKLQVERRFDPVLAGYGFDPLSVQQDSLMPETLKKNLLEVLGGAAIRQVPRCNPYSAIDGGYGGRFLTVIDSRGREFTVGANDAACAESNHDCEGPCLSQATMSQVFQLFAEQMPLPAKPETVFRCDRESPLACGSVARQELIVYGEWQVKELRGDVRLALASRLCQLDAFTMQQDAAGNWVVLNRSGEQVGVLQINSQTRLVTCLERRQT